MQKEVTKSWALFIGIGTIMIAHGLQMQLMGIRSVVENFSVITTGIFMSGYFMGYFLGSNTTPKLVQKVGHIRVFAAFASIASIVVLLHSIFVNPLTWFVLRVVTGISMVSIYTIAESWLNDRSSNKNRGSVLSIYMIVLYGSMAVGMFFLNFSSPINFQPFILISLFMSLALIPILLTKKKAPTFKKITGMSLSELYKVSPLGMIGSLFYGLGLIFAIPGLVLANGALIITNQFPNHPDAGVAKAAKICGWIGIGIAILMLMVVLLAFFLYIWASEG